MPKNIVILLDGTSNEISSDRTNILRLYGTLQKSDQQTVYYDPGVGTFGADNSWLRFWRKAIEIWGMATGWGLDQNVKEAYQFLVENYERGSGGEDRDKIYIIGFSRGAYTARVLAGFIHAVGLVEKRNANLIDYAYRAYKQIGEDDTDSFAEVRLYERVLEADRPPLKFLGLFDTVGSVIEIGRYFPRIRTHAFTQNNTSVEVVRHAVAIDEHRTMFWPQLWPQDGEYWGNPFNKSKTVPQNTKEVWFRGCHGDVGGGYPEASSGLAKIPLEWMIEETKMFGLKFKIQTVNRIVLGTDESKGYVKPDPCADAHNSMRGAWPILEYLPRRLPPRSTREAFFGITLPLFERRTIPEDACIHSSVLEHSQAAKQQPENLPNKFAIED